MADSKAQQIRDTIETRFKLIARANGYETDLGLNVFVDRVTPIEETECPSINLHAIDTPSDLTFGLHEHELAVEGDVSAVGEDVTAQLEKVLADLTKAIGTDLTWGGLAEDTRIMAAVPAYDQASRKVVGASVKFSVIFTTERWNAYA